MIKIELSFTKDDVEKLVARAIGSWGANPEYARVHCDREGRAGGYFGVKIRGNSTQITLNHDVVVAAIVDGSAAKGNPVDPASVKFNYIEGRGHGGAQSFSVKALPADASTPSVSQAAGKLTFPVPIELRFSEKETEALFASAMLRQPGVKKVGHISMYGGKSVSISLEMNGGQSANVTLDEAQFKQTLAEELTLKGYSVEADGCRLDFTPGRGYGGAASTCAVARLTALPLG